jgi:hypothetical protein
VRLADAEAPEVLEAVRLEVCEGSWLLDGVRVLVIDLVVDGVRVLVIDLVVDGVRVLVIDLVGVRDGLLPGHE